MGEENAPSRPSVNYDESTDATSNSQYSLRQDIGDRMVAVRQRLEKHYPVWSKVNYALIALSASYLLYRSRLGTQYTSAAQIPVRDFTRRRKLYGQVHSFTTSTTSDQASVVSLHVLHQPPLAWILPSRVYGSSGSDQRLGLLEIRLLGVRAEQRFTEEFLDSIGLTQPAARQISLRLCYREEDSDVPVCDVFYLPRDRVFFSKRLNVDVVGAGCARFKDDEQSGSYWLRRSINKIKAAESVAKKEKRGLWEFEEPPPEQNISSRVMQGVKTLAQRFQR